MEDKNFRVIYEKDIQEWMSRLNNNVKFVTTELNKLSKDKKGNMDKIDECLKKLKECDEISHWILKNETMYLACIGLFDD